VKSLLPRTAIEHSPYGEYFFNHVGDERVLFFHGSLGKVAAAASTQYVIDHFRPARLINIRTCGGVEGRIGRFEIVVPGKFVIYDIYSAIGDDPSEGHYMTELDLPAHFPNACHSHHALLRRPGPDTGHSAGNRRSVSSCGCRLGVRRNCVGGQAQRHTTAYHARREDLVSLKRGEAEGNGALWVENTRRVMVVLLTNLPKWMAAMTLMAAGHERWTLPCRRRCIWSWPY